ncbi:hypothetical protein EYF80_054461 [Liparis tanakae]|uniref:Uncharacterized protein n=1 Tax=Liparis tanakae TaxID=230148 RepID=A0A4Z2F3A3_9TELE|nr:hypothetical protein EYF80_054461 [Liparis tanakae]
MLNVSLMSVAVSAPLTSCLLASSTSGRPRSSSLCSVSSSSLRASSRRSRPAQSTTNTTAAASWWKLGQCSRILPWPPTSHTHFHVEADRGHGGDARVELQFVEESRFPRVVQTQQEDVQRFWLFGPSQSHGAAERDSHLEWDRPLIPVKCCGSGVCCVRCPELNRSAISSTLTNSRSPIRRRTRPTPSCRGDEFKSPLTPRSARVGAGAQISGFLLPRRLHGSRTHRGVRAGGASLNYIQQRVLISPDRSIQDRVQFSPGFTHTPPVGLSITYTSPPESQRLWVHEWTVDFSSVRGDGGGQADWLLTFFSMRTTEAGEQHGSSRSHAPARWKITRASMEALELCCPMATSVQTLTLDYQKRMPKAL